MEENGYQKYIIAGLNMFDCGCKFEIKNGQPIIDFDLNKINLDCKLTWDLIGSGKTIGLFQIDSPLGQMMSKKLKPENIHHLAALIAILRPSCLQGVLDDGKSIANHFIDRKNGIELVKYKYPILESILKETFGLQIYQEHSISIAKEIAGFSLQEADTLRKCIASGSLVYTKSGPRKIDDLAKIFKTNTKNIPSILSINKNKITYYKIKNIWSNGIKEIYRLKTTNGFSIDLTQNHEVFTQDGWKKLSDLKSKIDFVIIPKKYNFLQDNKNILNPKLSQLLGFFISEGCYTINSTCPKITNKSIELLNIIKSTLIENFGPNSYKEYINKYTGCTDIYFKGNAKKWIQDNYFKSKSKDKKLTFKILRQESESLKAFIGGFFSGEGTISDKNIDISSTSELLLRQIQAILIKYEIHSNFYEKNGFYLGKPYKSYRLYICNFEDIIKFKNKFGKYIITEKLIKIDKINIPSHKNPRFKIPSCFIKSSTKDINVNSLFGYPENKVDGSLYNQNLTYERARKLNHKINSEILTDILDADYFFVPIKSIDFIGEKEVFDFEIDGNIHAGFVNGILVHNSIGKKDSELMSKLESLFIEGCEKTGKISKNGAIELFNIIKASQRYSFCKSHAYSYAITTYTTALVKAHFPLRFFKSWLNHSIDKMKPLDEIKNLVNDARSFDIQVNNPDLRLKNDKFIIKDGQIYFGLQYIKGVGDSAFNTLVALVDAISQNQDIEHLSWCKMLCTVLLRANRAVVKHLIAVGALDYLNIARERLLFEHDIALKFSKKEIEWIISNINLQQHTSIETVISYILTLPTGKNQPIANKNRKNIINNLLLTLVKLPFSVIDNIDRICALESSYLGVPLKFHKTDSSDKGICDTTCREIQEGKRGKLTILAEILKINETVSKKSNKKMCFLSVEDSTGTLENIVLFEESLERFRNSLFVGNVVLLSGYISKFNSLVVQNCQNA